MLMMLGKDVVEIRAPDGSWQRPGTAQLKPENVLEYLLDAIDMGVFMPDSDMRPVVRSLFGGSPSVPAAWEGTLVPSPKVDGELSGALLCFAGPRHLCADVVNEATDSIFVYRPREPDDWGFSTNDVQNDGDVALTRNTADGLTRARTEHKQTVVYHMHENPILGNWFLADRRAERKGEPSPPLYASVLREWTKIREQHGIRYPHGLEFGLPETPERDLRGDPFWR